jgi:hypothetical protein
MVVRVGCASRASDADAVRSPVGPRIYAAGGVSPYQACAGPAAQSTCTTASKFSSVGSVGVKQAVLGDSGLFYSYKASYPWHGRIRFVPFANLPIAERVASRTAADS